MLIRIEEVLTQEKQPTHRWKILFGYDPIVIQAFKQRVLWTDRKYDPDRQIWFVFKNPRSASFLDDFVRWAERNSHRVMDRRLSYPRDETYAGPSDTRYDRDGWASQENARKANDDWERIKEEARQRGKAYDEGTWMPPGRPPRTGTGTRVFDELFTAVGPDKVKSVYRALSRVLHPDVGGDAELFKALSAAYERKGG